MSDLLAIARQRRAVLVAELAKLDSFIELYQILDVEVRLDEHSANVRLLDEPTIKPKRRTRVYNNPSPKEVVAASVSIIFDEDRPMTRREIHTKLAERGMHVYGADPLKTLGTMLWRSGKDRLIGIPGRGYGLRNVDYDDKNESLFKGQELSH